MRVRFSVLVVATAIGSIVACDSGPPIKTASGEILDGIKFEETFPLSNDVKETSMGGERLRNAVATMDKHRLFNLRT